MTIYTKRGDRGKTSLFDPQNRQDRRISKNSLTIRAIGAIDELNSYLGICVSISEDSQIVTYLKEVQANLFAVGSILAGSKLRFGSTETKKLEKIIDQLEGELPVLKNFILPGGSKLASHLQYSRAICRRTERKVILLSKSEKVNSEILVYLNRLSDFLFMLARKANRELRIKDEIWK